MAKLTPEQLLQRDIDQLEQAHRHWRAVYELGCQDPFWPDGCNLNLIRNHIMSFKDCIALTCEENGFLLPDIYYEPVPDEVPNNYMANLDQTERVKRLKQMGEKLTTKRSAVKEDQMAFW